jgi:hypothetical protein
MRSNAGAGVCRADLSESDERRVGVYRGSDEEDFGKGGRSREQGAGGGDRKRKAETVKADFRGR